MHICGERSLVSSKRSANLRKASVSGTCLDSKGRTDRMLDGDLHSTPLNYLVQMDVISYLNCGCPFVSQNGTNPWIALQMVDVHRLSVSRQVP